MNTQGEEKGFWQQPEFQNNENKVEYLYFYPQVIFFFIYIYTLNTFQIAINHWKYNPTGWEIDGEIFVAKTNIISEGSPLPSVIHLDCKAKVDYFIANYWTHLNEVPQYSMGDAACLEEESNKDENRSSTNSTNEFSLFILPWFALSEIWGSSVLQWFFITERGTE